MKVVLVGYMASGKSSIGRALADDLELNYVDLDSFIEKEMGMSIQQIFSNRGEIFFRKKEYETLGQILKNENDIVLSTGGGTPCYGNNMQTILDHSDTSIYLQLSIPSLVERISQEKDSRPLVQNIKDEDLPEFVGKHLFERRNFYMQAKETVICDGKAIREVVDEIKTRLL
ncbi:shikimate kinase [Flagellimonas meridianipacifica]|uniref:Shikimate kinase n=1 Tax=Flagellimonas meridianipacifica TaxID=1080225 RepID=A0A2T0M6U5_9FLAO|nr:shikimate kinase [Allomuricauda pacifica]PRX53219.1 shikimate kinase [Allomuricauda pacifica]